MYDLIGQNADGKGTKPEKMKLTKFQNHSFCYVLQDNNGLRKID